MHKEQIKPKGRIHFLVKDKNGKVKFDSAIDWDPSKLAADGFLHNTITNTGKAEAAGLIGGATTGVFDYIAVGTGTTAAAASDTALQTEVSTSGLSRAQGTASRSTTTVTNDTLEITKTFSVTGSVAVTEAGLFDAASTGIMLARQVFSAINVANGDSLQITWKIQLT